MNDSDDDGIQLNLAGTSSSTDVPGSRRLRPTAGSWKQRSAERKQRQQQQHRPAGHPTTTPAGAAASASVSAVVRHGPPAAKAAAVTSKAPAARNSRPPAADHDAPANPKQPQTQTQQRRGHFVTSLFTSNPELKPIGARAAPAVERPAGTFRDLSTLVARDAASFTDLGLHPRLSGHLASAMDATRPTPIQRAALARLLGAHSSSLSSSFTADVCLEARTGSGKTLAFLLPVIHWLVRCEEEVGAGVRLDRGLGTLAVVLAPTRELAKQTYDVLERLLRYPSGRGGDASDAGDAGGGGGGARLGHWIVGSLVVGGEKKKSEKARLRKGATILVSTPGRLLDHLKTTKAFAVENLRWVVLDEADRLLDLGFETAVKEILQLLDERRQLAVKQGTRLKISCWPRDRQVLLASATLKQGVVDLADSILRSPVVLRESEQQQQQNPAAQSSVAHLETSDSAPGVAATAASGDDAFAVPSSLKQKYTVVPLKLRLVSLIALLRGMALDKTKAFKAIVFVYTRDIADFLFHAVTKGLDAAVAAPPRGRTVAPVAAFADGDGSTAVAAQEPPVRKFGDRTAAPALDEASVASVVDNAVLGGVQVVRLHGEMAQALRTRAYAAFAGARRGVLFCTDVAARGLDLPDVSDVVQYDQPCELADYIHRVGRTARFGRRGNAVSLLLPCEEGYVQLLEARSLALGQVDGAGLLDYFRGVELPDPDGGGAGKPKRRKGPSTEDVASDIQNALERFVLSNPKNQELARSAFRSYVRAYATHSAAERSVFHLKNLHLGHLAKSFALREAPAVAGLPNGSSKGKKKGFKAAEEKARAGGGAGGLKRKAAEAVRAMTVAEFGDGVAELAGGGGPKRRRRRL